MAGLFTPAPPGTDPFTSALNNLAQGFLGAQDIYGKRQTQEAHTALYKVQTDLERAKLARERAEFEDRRVEFERQQANRPQSETIVVNGGEAEPKRGGGRWLERLGLRDKNDG